MVKKKKKEPKQPKRQKVEAKPEEKKVWHKRGEFDIDPDLKAHYENLTEVVERHKAGDQKATEEFFQLMEPYLEKYTLILQGANVDLSNKDTSAFYRLFVPGYITSAKLSSLKETFRHFSEHLTADDIKQELVLILLEKVLPKISKHGDIDLLRPITLYFRWRVKDWFNKIVKDTLYYASEDLDAAFDIPAEDSMGEFDTRRIFDPITPKGKQLTPEQRYILALYFSRKQSITQIASKLCLKKSDVRVFLAKIKKEVEALE